MNCPKCGFGLGSNLGVSLSGSEGHHTDSVPQSSLLSDQTRPRVRGKAREYSDAFETAWRAYGRKDEKLRAYGEWIIQARLAGGDTLLLPLILASLRWQGPIWAAEGWKFAPYFERYLKRRKWEDEPPPVPQRITPPPDDRGIRAVDRNLAKLHAVKTATADELAALRGKSNG